MLTALQALRGEYDFDIEQVDVDTDPAAERKYDELVPVLTDADDRELCHYHLDVLKLREYLGNFRQKLG